MTRQRKLLFLGAALIVLVGGYFGATAHRRAQIDRQMEQHRAANLTEIDTDKVVRLDLPLEGIVLERKGEVWGSPAEALGVQLDQEEIDRILWSLSNMRYDRIAEENPTDLAQYGLSPPRSRVILTLEDASTVEMLGGDQTPTGTGYYAMRVGDPRVYILPSFPGERLFVSLTDFRNRNLTAFAAEEVERLTLNHGTTRIAIERKPATGALESTFTTHILTSPYRIPRGADIPAFNNLITAIRELRIRDFVNDNPTTLAPYGLDKPAIEISIQGMDKSLHLLIGKDADAADPQWEEDTVFAKLKDSPTVFLLEDIRDRLAIRPFDLVDKFAFILNKQRVDKLIVEYRGTRHVGEIKWERTTVTEKDSEGRETQREEARATYFFNGREVQARDFKNFYQSCIGLLIDGELPAGSRVSGKPSITMEFHLNDPKGLVSRIQYIPFNRDFYALSRDGTIEFLVSKRQTEEIGRSLQALLGP